jgi:hypothetical protein
MFIFALYDIYLTKQSCSLIVTLVSRSNRTQMLLEQLRTCTITILDLLMWPTLSRKYFDYSILKVQAYSLVNSLDFFWCPGTTCPDATGNLSLKNATFDNFSGSGTSSRAGVTVDCLDNEKCTDLTYVFSLLVHQ